ncbi:MAG: DUF2306 domain-containing protein [Planctomycetales bacterium]|nr:DUF2306 domain-containing protein [Planctomycetales bacterium]
MNKYSANPALFIGSYLRKLITEYVIHVKTSLQANPQKWLRILSIATCLLLAKVFVTILIEYSNYFPPNFAAAFLVGRHDYFWDYYWLAFYIHIVASPVVLIICTWQLWSARRGQRAKLHPVTGILQAVLTVVLVVPSGIVLSYWARAGILASAGFSCQSIVLLAATITSVWNAAHGNSVRHRYWAIVTWILLCSPLLFRVATGVAIVIGGETVLFFQLNAWLSWIIPLLLFQHYWARVGDFRSRMA